MEKPNKPAIDQALVSSIESKWEGCKNTNDGGMVNYAMGKLKGLSGSAQSEVPKGKTLGLSMEQLSNKMKARYDMD